MRTAGELLEVNEALGRVVEVRDCLMQGMSRIVGKLMLEVAKCNGALEKSSADCTCCKQTVSSTKS